MIVLDNRPLRRLIATVALAALVAVAGCSAPMSDPVESVAATTSSAESTRTPTATRAPAAPALTTPATNPQPAPRSKPAPPMSDPLPALQVPETVPATGGGAPSLDLSCKASADCAVKNVGSCCGVLPRCVNVNARVYPEAVQAQCARSGMASVCGFKPVESCQCMQGQCQDQPMSGAQ